jgi:hypothetical protein
LEERKTPIPAFEDAQLDGDSQNDFRRGLGGAEGLIKTQNRANVVVFAAREQSRPFDEAVAELANIVEIFTCKNPEDRNGERPAPLLRSVPRRTRETAALIPTAIPWSEIQIGCISEEEEEATENDDDILVSMVNKRRNYKVAILLTPIGWVTIAGEEDNVSRNCNLNKNLMDGQQRSKKLGNRRFRVGDPVSERWKQVPPELGIK